MLTYSTIKKIRAMMNSQIIEEMLAYGIRVSAMPMSYEIKGLMSRMGNWHHIVINSNIPADQQWNAFLHELYHIANDDLDNDDSVEDIESRNPY